MENLWKTAEDDASKGQYVDIFASVQNEFGHCFNEWDKYIDEVQIGTAHTKCNRTAERELEAGHEYFKITNYRAAMQKYNECLSFAEPNTKWESLAYEHRAACFISMNMYAQASTDIHLAMKFKQETRTSLRLQAKFSECQKQLNAVGPTEMAEPRLDYAVNKDFPCLANVLEIREDGEFGRHIVAKCDIGVGKIVLATNTFASVAVSDTLTTCSFCTKIERNFIACADCSNAMFCRDTCADRIGAHRLECGTIYHHIDTNLKLPIQTLLMAIEMFSSIDKLMEFVKCYVAYGNNGHGIPKAASDTKSKYALFLTLIRTKSNDCIYSAYQVYKTLLAFPRIRCLANTAEKMLFLAHLTVHHVTVIVRNSFEYVKRDKDATTTTDYIYDVLSVMMNTLQNYANETFIISNQFGLFPNHSLADQSFLRPEFVYRVGSRSNFILHDSETDLDRRTSVHQLHWLSNDDTRGTTNVRAALEFPVQM